jgi:hypothetical protein
VLREAEDEVTIRVSREQSTVGDTGEASVEISSYSQGLTDEETRSLQQVSVFVVCRYMFFHSLVVHQNFNLF